jgi:hypothetical protein
MTPSPFGAPRRVTSSVSRQKNGFRRDEETKHSLTGRKTCFNAMNAIRVPPRRDSRRQLGFDMTWKTVLRFRHPPQVPRLFILPVFPFL